MLQQFASTFVPLIRYPPGFPLPDRQPYGIAADMGVVRSPMAAGNARQRRLYRHMPQQFQLSFHLHTSELYQWQYWVNLYAYDWFALPLASMFAPPANWSPDGIQPAGQISPHIARFISDLSISMDGYDWFGVTVAAEVSPDMLAFVPRPPGMDVIDAGTPDNPSPATDVLDGRFPNAPATGGPVDAGPANDPS